MFRQAKFNGEIPDKTAEVAAIIAEEGLRYVSDSALGYSGKRTGTSFSFHDKDGDRIVNPDIIRRIKSIGIPPPYESVWICPSPSGHIDLVLRQSQGRLDVVKRSSAFRTEITERNSADEKSDVLAIPIRTCAVPAAIGLGQVAAPIR